MDETSQKIIDAAMALIRDKGYAATTTKDIAREAGVNECTLFRKFQSKKDIAVHGVSQEKWRADVTPELFAKVQWELEPDLEMFMNTYMDRITPDFVNMSVGLRAPQLYKEILPLIMKIPRAFVSSLTEYLKKMEELGKIGHHDYESLAMSIFSSAFGYTFLKAAFEERLIYVSREDYVRSSVQMFVKGIR